MTLIDVLHVQLSRHESGRVWLIDLLVGLINCWVSLIVIDSV